MSVNGKPTVLVMVLARTVGPPRGAERQLTAAAVDRCW
jgi:hypothetical protein